MNSPWPQAPLLSAILGWGYFLAWSASFWPQLVINYRRKSVDGLSLDFLAYNIVGFSCYSVYTLSFYFSSSVQQEFKRRNDGRENLVATNDVVFAIHAWALTIATGLQAVRYRRRRHSLSGFAKLVLAAFFASTVLMLGWTVDEPVTGALDLVYFLGSWKLVMSLIKYIPQMWVNFRDKSTEGWSIHNILLDSTGGILSLTQLFLDAWIAARDGPAAGHGSWLVGAIFGNATKLGLALLSLGFDALFLVQHFVLYRGRPRPDLSYRREIRSPSQEAYVPTETDPLLNA